MLVRQRGFSLLELAITMTILGFAMAIAYPNFSAWITNLQIRSAAEKIQSSVQFARSEALRRNSPMSFFLTNSLNSGCALSSTGNFGVVAKTDPSGACDGLASDDVAPFIARKDLVASNSTTVVAVGGAGASSGVTFNGIGRTVTTAAWISEITIDAPPAATFRQLKVQIKPGGQSRICDPAISSSTDSRRCD